MYNLSRDLEMSFIVSNLSCLNSSNTGTVLTTFAGDYTVTIEIDIDQPSSLEPGKVDFSLSFFFFFFFSPGFH